MTPEEDRFWRIVLGSAVIVTIGAFRPQLARLMRRLGFREEYEVKTTGGKRAVVIFGAAVLIFVVLLAL